MSEFYEVHCTNCGEVISADRMAIDLDELIHDYLKIQIEDSGNEELRTVLEDWSYLRLGMYLSPYEMVQKNFLDEGKRLIIKASDILKFIGEKYSRNKFQLHVNDSGRLELPDDIRRELTLKLPLYNTKDVDREEKSRRVQEAVEFLANSPDVLFLECICEFRKSLDDRGKEYIDQVLVTKVNGEKKQYQHMVCPKCGEQFYAHAGQHEERVIVMLGSSRVGKTAYLAALVDTVNRSLKNTGITVTGGLDQRYEAFINNILNDYRAGRKITKTEADVDDKSTVPLLSLQVRIGERIIIFTLVDMPGEVFVPRSEAEQMMGEADGYFIVNRRMICKSASAFWFCVDPVQIDTRLEMINTGRENTDRVSVDIDNVLQNVDNMLYLMGANMKDKPAAIILTKSDLLSGEGPLSQRGIEWRDYHLYSRQETNEPYLYLRDGSLYINSFQQIVDYVKAYIYNDYNDGGVKETFEIRINNMFTHKNFFSVAAYGREADEKSADRAPYGVVLPFLWTLACMGYLPVTCSRFKTVKTGFLGLKEEVRSYTEPAEYQDLFVN